VGEITRQDKSLGLPASTRLLGKTCMGLNFMWRGKAVKALTRKVRPFRDLQVRGLRDCANRESGLGSSLLHWVPVHLPVVCTPPLYSLDADRWGPRNAWNGHSQPQWPPLRAQLGPPAPDVLPVCNTSRPQPQHALLVHPAPTPTSRRGPRASLLPQVKHKDKQIHPTETIQAFYQLICLWFRDKTMTTEIKDDLT